MSEEDALEEIELESKVDVEEVSLELVEDSAEQDVVLDEVTDADETSADIVDLTEKALDDFDIDEPDETSVAAAVLESVEDGSASEFSLDDLESEDESEALSLDTEVETAESAEDSELDLIFLEEAKENLALLSSVLDEAAEAVNPDAVAAYHTLKGSSGMAEVPAVVVVAAPMESLLANMLASSQNMNDIVRELMKESLDLMGAISEDLSLKRQTSPEHEAFAEKVRSISGPGAEPTPLFDFQLVRKLSEAEPVVREWQPVGMGALQVELSHVIEQAGPLGHTSIVELCKRLLQIYQQLSMKPADSVVETLLSAHETLVHMFDELASSQTIQSGSEILQKLDDLDRDLKAPKATEAISRSLLPLDALLPELDTRLENLNSEAASQEALQAVLSQLSELQGVDDLASSPLNSYRSLKSQRVRKSPWADC